MVEWAGIAESAFRAANPRLPLVDAGRCLAVRHAATSCRACVAACPRSAVTRLPAPRLDPGSCDGCGACVAACPTGAIEAPDDAGRMTHWLAQLEAHPGGDALVVCERAVTPTGARAVAALVLPCLGALRASDVVAARSRGATTLLLAAPDCVRCSRAPAGARAAEVVDVSRAALASIGATMTIERVEAAPVPGGGGDGPVVSRRALFGLVRDRARRAVVEVARDSEPAASRLARGGRIPAWRTRLETDLRTLVERHTAAPGTLPLELGTGRPFVVGTCDACGLCALVCPLHAVSVDGGSVEFDVTRCTACGVCAEICPAAALALTPRAVAAITSTGAGGGSDRNYRASRSPLDAGLLAGRASAADRRIRDDAARRLLLTSTERTA